MSIDDNNEPKVLLVDDESDIAEIMKIGLERNGFMVDAFTNPHTALTEYRNNSYDIHVLDVRMPGMSGFDLARKIWEIKPDAKVCFFTAFEIYESEAKRIFPSLQSHCFVTKPISAKELATHIRMHMVNS